VTSLSEQLAALGLARPAFYVPGRIEVLGKHTDYAGGRSLLCAIDRGVFASVEPRNDATVRVTDTVRGETREVPIAEEIETPAGDWSNYVATVVRRMARNFPPARRGADISMASTLPAASGMSSSSALTIAVFMALDAVNELSKLGQFQAAISSREALAAYLASVEMGEGFGELRGDRGVGTFGGSEDHTAILCCRAEALSQYSFRPTRAEGDVPFPSGSVLVVAFSGVAAEKTGRAMALYNELSLSTRTILDRWNAASGRADSSLGAAVAGGPDVVARIRGLLGSERRLRDRFDQFVLESVEIVPRASAALARGDFALFGELVNSSQLGAEELLGNQIPETRALVRMAKSAGADAASAFGAGFGGSVWALVGKSGAAEFIEEWRATYARKFPESARRAEFFATRPGPGASAV
jgi:galactokinase